MNKITSFIKHQPLVAVFFLVLLVSLVWQESFRNLHFQECDSAGVYYILQEFPKSGLAYTTLSYPSGHIITPQIAQKLLNIPKVHSLAIKYFGNYSDQDMVARLGSVNPFALFRYGFITAISLLHLPFFLQSLFALPLSSTYGAGVGLVYGLLTTRGMPFEIFMSHLLFVNIILFHVMVLLLFFILKKIGIRPIVAIVTSLLMLFSISLYSQGYNAGSPLWIFASEFLWLWYMLKNFDSTKFNKKVSTITAVLIFFNYLIVLFWAALMLVRLSQKLNGHKKNVKNLASAIWQLIKEQWIAIVGIVICALLFVQPGQGLRVGTTLKTFTSDAYYVVLNFFAWYTHSKPLEILQFIIALSLLLTFAYWLIKKPSATTSPTLAFLHSFVRWFVLIYLVMLLGKQLGFAPTRHMLFLTPIIFIGAGIALEQLAKTIHFNFAASIVIILLLAFLGFVSYYIRQLDARDITLGLTFPANTSLIGVNDCSYQWVYRNWHNNIPVDFIHPKLLQPDKSYIYMSQTIPFSTFLQYWSPQYNINVTVNSETDKFTNAYPQAYNPDPARYGFSRPNNLYETYFTVNQVTKK